MLSTLDRSHLRGLVLSMRHKADPCCGCHVAHCEQTCCNAAASFLGSIHFLHFKLVGVGVEGGAVWLTAHPSGAEDLQRDLAALSHLHAQAYHLTDANQEMEYGYNRSGITHGRHACCKGHTLSSMPRHAQAQSQSLKIVAARLCKEMAWLSPNVHPMLAAPQPQPRPPPPYSSPAAAAPFDRRKSPARPCLSLEFLQHACASSALNWHPFYGRSAHLHATCCNMSSAT
jgi:hypothetical protein